MKTLSILTIAVLACFPFTVPAQTSPVTDAVNATPESVVNAIFAAARTGDVGKLPSLCDPAGTGDGDVKDICAVKNIADKGFADFFKTGKIAGPAKTDGLTAQVPILFGPDGAKSEIMLLKKVGDKWYLESF